MLVSSVVHKEESRSGATGDKLTAYELAELLWGYEDVVRTYVEFARLRVVHTLEMPVVRASVEALAAALIARNKLSDRGIQRVVGDARRAWETANGAPPLVIEKALN
jgi:hypothetical protein